MKINTQFTIQKRYKFMTPEAEKFNGWMAMIGFVAAVGALSLIHISEPTRPY